MDEPQEIPDRTKLTYEISIFPPMSMSEVHKISDATSHVLEEEVGDILIDMGYPDVELKTTITVAQVYKIISDKER